MPDDYLVPHDTIKRYYRPDKASFVPIDAIYRCYMSDQIWFKNDHAQQALVIDLYTDYHRTQSLQFYTNCITNEVVEWLSFPMPDSCYLKNEQRRFIAQYSKYAVNLSLDFFKTEHGLKLGITPAQAISAIGEKPSRTTGRKRKIYYWDYPGEYIFWDTTFVDTYVVKPFDKKKVAESCAGYHIKILFQNERATVICIENDPP